MKTGATLSENFGMKIKLERIKHSTTQKKLSELVGISANTLYLIEKGKKKYPKLTPH